MVDKGGKIKLFQNRPTIYPKYLDELVSVEVDEDLLKYRKKSQTLSVLDLLIKGAKAVKYFRADRKETSFAYFEYDSIEEARNRKFLLALITYSFSTRLFVRSREFYPNDTVRNIQQ